MSSAAVEHEGTANVKDYDIPYQVAFAPATLVEPPLEEVLLQVRYQTYCQYDLLFLTMLLNSRMKCTVSLNFKKCGEWGQGIMCTHQNDACTNSLLFVVKYCHNMCFRGTFFFRIMTGAPGWDPSDSKNLDALFFTLFTRSKWLSRVRRVQMSPK